MKLGCGRVVHLAERCSISMRSFPSSLNVAPEYRLSYVDAEKPAYHHLKTLFFFCSYLTDCVRIGTWLHSSRLDNFKDICPILVTDLQLTAPSHTAVSSQWPCLYNMTWPSDPCWSDLMLTPGPSCVDQSPSLGNWEPKQRGVNLSLWLDYRILGGQIFLLLACVIERQSY